jgi:hypothetical protein
MVDTKARCPACAQEERLLDESLARQKIADQRLLAVQARRNALAGEAASLKAQAETQRERAQALKPILSATFPSLDQAASGEQDLQTTQAQSQVVGSVENYKLERQALIESSVPLTNDLRQFQETLAGIDAEEQEAQEAADMEADNVQSATDDLNACNKENCGAEGKTTETIAPGRFSLTMESARPMPEEAEAEATPSGQETSPEASNG